MAELKKIQATTKIKNGKLIAIASSESEDRVGDSLKMKDWFLDNYLDNPVLQAGHDHNPQFTIGKAENIRVEGSQLIFEPKFHEITQLAKEIKQMYEEGVLTAWSVGFIPGAINPNAKGQGSKDKNELLEISAVAVPANSDCLTEHLISAKSYGESDISKINKWLKKEIDTTDINKEKKKDDKKEDKKDLITSGTSRVNEHVHVAKYDSDNGNGQTSTDNKHLHFIEKFIILESKEHTHTINFDKDDDKGKYGKDGKKKPKKKDETTEVKKIVRWNKSLSKIFNVENVPSRSNNSMINLLSKYLECEIKEIFVNDFLIPSPLLGSYLKGFKDTFSEYKLKDIRNFNESDGTERPLVYEVLQIKSDKKEEFLIQGVKFYEKNNTGFIVKYEPTWYGMQVSIGTKISDKEDNKELMEDVHKWVKENNFLKGEKFSLSGQFITNVNKKWEDVILPKSIEESVKKSIGALDKKGKDAKSRGLLFMGEPGTGKTQTGKVMMSESDTTFIWVSSKDFDALQPTRALKLSFKLARDLAPSILFMEDIDTWIRGYNVDLIKTEMDGIQENKGMMTILTTNNPDQLPKALIDRPGRFHDILNFTSPNTETRKKMLKMWAIDITDENLNTFVKETKGFSGAYIKELVDFAIIIMEDEGLDINKALFRSLIKIKEQKELIENIGAGDVQMIDDETEETKEEQLDKSINIDIKEGRILSSKNKETVNKCIISLKSTSTVLEKLMKSSNKVDDNKEEKITPEKTVKRKDKKTTNQLLKSLRTIAKESNFVMQQVNKRIKEK